MPAQFPPEVQSLHIDEFIDDLGFSWPERGNSPWRDAQSNARRVGSSRTPDRTINPLAVRVMQDAGLQADVGSFGGVCVELGPHVEDPLAAWAAYHDHRYNLRDKELSSQVEMLPKPDEVSTVVWKLKVDDLREFATSVMNIAVDSAHKGNADLDTVRLLNGWFATMEENIAAGDNIDEILSRRRKSQEPHHI